MFRLGLVINPLAGLGGPLGLKGSDDYQLPAGAVPSRSTERTERALTALLSVRKNIEILGFEGPMAGDLVAEMGFQFTPVGSQKGSQSCAEDTGAAVKALLAVGIDLLLFAGGDGTARDIAAVLGKELPVLGIPAGVKMHSAVYAITPDLAGDITLNIINKGLINIELSEVRDIDEVAFRAGKARSRYYAELLVPRQGYFVQHVKEGGVEVEELVIDEIGAHLLEELEDGRLYLVGPGSTTTGLMRGLGLEFTLLGIDAVLDRKCIASDINEPGLLKLLDQHRGPVSIILTPIGGQGHILGRGNQPFSPAVIRRVGLDNLIIVASKTKIRSLENRPLLVDSNDPMLDQELAGYKPVLTGYHDKILYPVGLT